MWDTLPSIADWDCFKTPTLCVFGSHTFVPISWMCKNQTSVSHSSTESEIISLDTGPRLDGLPALELWDLIVSVFGNVSRVSDRSGKPDSDDHKHHKSQKKINALNNIELVRVRLASAVKEAGESPPMSSCGTWSPDIPRRPVSWRSVPLSSHSYAQTVSRTDVVRMRVASLWEAARRRKVRA